MAKEAIIFLGGFLAGEISLVGAYCSGRYDWFGRAWRAVSRG